MDIKSTRSFNAGLSLIANKFYSQSIHCFYYSVLQMMKFKLATCSINPIDYEGQTDKAKLNNKSTHDWLFHEILYRIPLKGKMKENFIEDFKILKNDRVVADYRKRSFTQDESAGCRLIADRLLANLRNLK